VEREAKRPHGSGGFSGVSFGGQSHHKISHPYRPTQMASLGHHGASVSHGSYGARLGQLSYSALPAQSSYHGPSSKVYTGSFSVYEGQQRIRRGCYEHEDLIYLKSDCPRLLSRHPQQRSQAMTSTPVTSPPAQLARSAVQIARGRPRGGGRSGSD